jgi:hypothetical protein
VSQLCGSGYGDSHKWVCGDTVYKRTLWSCSECGAAFLHAYDVQPSIHRAIEEAGIHDACTPSPEAKAALKRAGATP